MTDLRELAHRLVSDEVLEGKDAQTIMGVATEAAPWQLWVQVALAYLELGQPDQATYILEQLLQTDGCRGGPTCPPSSSSARSAACA